MLFEDIVFPSLTSVAVCGNSGLDISRFIILSTATSSAFFALTGEASVKATRRARKTTATKNNFGWKDMFRKWRESAQIFVTKSNKNGR